MTEKVVPTFANEAEEAQWWFENREAHAEQFLEAFAEGRVRRGGIAQRVEAARNASLAHLAPESSDDYFVERHEGGKFRVRVGGSHQASAIFATQAEAVAYAKQLNPQKQTVVVWVRDMEAAA